MGAELIPVVKSQAEALEGDVSYDYCMITTKCLPDVLPTPKLVEEVIASKKVKAWSLIQVGRTLLAK
jgi:2-dehydropantoate 2-reductase